MPQGVQVRVLFPAPVMTKTPWSRNQKIAVWGVCIPVVLAVLSLFSPEVRRFVGLEKPIAPPTPVARIETPPPSTPQTHPAVSNSKASKKPHIKPVRIDMQGTGNVVAGSITQSGNCNVNQIGGNGNSGSVNCAPQLRIPEQRVDPLAAFLSARRGTVSITVRNAVRSDQP